MKNIFELLTPLIAAFATVYAVDKSFKLARIEKTKNDLLELRYFYQSLLIEVNTLINVYKNSVGNVIETWNIGNPFMYRYKVEQNYFIIYDSNAIKVGSISDDRLRESIVSTYITMKSHVDTMCTNNEILNDYDKIRNYYTVTQLNAYAQIQMEVEKSLANYSGSIVSSHQKMISGVDKLRADLEKAIEDLRFKEVARSSPNLN